MKRNSLKFIFYNIVLPLLLLVALVVGVWFAAVYTTGYGYDTIIFAQILIFSMVMGLSYVALFFMSRKYANKRGDEFRKVKRRIENFRQKLL